MNKIPVSGYTIRFADCDLFGHLNNARYLDYFLQAREEHLLHTYDLNLANYYKQGLGWLVGGHQVSYLKPAAYQEPVSISSMLISAAPDSLLVEMQMRNKDRTQLKSLLWTRFIPVNIQTGQRQDHPAAFMDFARSIAVDVAVEDGYDLRLKTVLATLKKETRKV